LDNYSIEIYFDVSASSSSSSIFAAAEGALASFPSRGSTKGLVLFF
jgi:hypothetical protein